MVTLIDLLEQEFLENDYNDYLKKHSMFALSFGTTDYVFKVTIDKEFNIMAVAFYDINNNATMRSDWMYQCESAHNILHEIVKRNLEGLNDPAVYNLIIEPISESIFNTLIGK